MVRSKPVRPLTEEEKAYIALRREIQRQDQEEAERMASVQLWRDCQAESWCADAARALAEVNGVRAAREAKDQSRWRSRALAAELGFDPDGLGL